MLGVLRTLARPWRWVRQFRSLKHAVITQLRQILDLQHTMQAEVRELHQSSLLAAIHVIEEQQRAREELARECVRLEQRLEALERQLGVGSENAPDSPTTERSRAA
jgi:hypothetical protein